LQISGEDSPVLKDLKNGLLVSYIVDEGSRFTYVQNRHLRAAGIDELTLHKTAVHNLYSVAEKHLKVQPYGPVFSVFMEGNFEASVLLLDTVWDVSFAQYVCEDFVAAIPARDVLAFGDSSSAEAIKGTSGDHRSGDLQLWRPRHFNVDVPTPEQTLDGLRQLRGRSMSSIKRDVKKKTPLRPESEIVSRDPAHCK
jgi:hypothetical protein